MSTVVVTGAAGRIGSVVCPGLSEAGWSVRRTDLPDADLSDPAAEPVLTALLDGADAVVHLAGIAGEDAWPRILAANIDATHRVLQAAREAGVRRVVLASSNHATGFTPRPADGPLPADADLRPDTYYGVSKVTMEALGALYVERHGMDVVALRIGSFLRRPTSARHLATWLSPGDCVRLVLAALTAPSPGFVQVWGISANTRAWWDPAAGRALGYQPVDDSEHYAADIGTEPAATDDLVGGEFCERDPIR